MSNIGTNTTDGRNYRVENILSESYNDTVKAIKTTILSLPDGLTGFEIPAYNYIVLTYVASGNGIGEIHTVIYKTGGSGGITVATLTLVYNADNEISSITKT